MPLRKPILIIIPGLGDRVRGYSLLSVVWRLLGYDTRIFSFKWEDPTESFSASLKRLLDYIDELSVPIYIIGASAGGSAAVNALYARPHAVQKVATIAAVFQRIPHLNNGKLKDSIENLSSTSIPEPDQRILSVYGLYDQKVPVESTRQLKASYRQIPVIGHALIIVAALSIYAHQIKIFLSATQRD